MKIIDLKHADGLMPTLFDMGEVWRLNSSRCKGRFNLIFFWLYPIAALGLIPITILVFIEAAFTEKTNKETYRHMEHPALDGQMIWLLQRDQRWITDKQRVEFWDKLQEGYCRYCGRVVPLSEFCHCQDDE